jgi:hypothetical protein
VINWAVLGLLLLVMSRFVGTDHPPVDDMRLGTGRKVVAVGTLLLFFALFMPSPWVSF